MSRIAIAGLQLEGPNGDNLAHMEAEIDSAMRRFPWLDMLVASELNACGTDVRNAEPMPGPREQRFCGIARRHGIWLVPGSMFEAADGVVYNTVPVISPQGEIVARYRKMFPWLPYEADTTPGDTPVVFDVPGVGCFGISNCYDIWFPETARALSSLGAEVILHPSLTSTIDRQAEHNIICATAAMHQCYVFDVNLGPSVGCGQSMMAGPGGEVLYSAGRGREVIPLRLDLDYVRDVRKNGWNGLSQNLKAFRDSKVPFASYNNGAATDYLNSLGPLEMPTRPTQSNTDFPQRDN
ncbi:carbon-nitrogen hydrolase family protein [Woeseia oceani]|uniref:Hydrolase n=1 Tax=Woeseia oceani TaxID=1548547 RepID=A0A193LHZ7_9GAMM|nr:carbon-nitrogen hydrolase family protein [Woeseia oceani]ANO52116.1 hydrolase [Woeseia oceani]